MLFLEYDLLTVITLEFLIIMYTVLPLDRASPVLPASRRVDCKQYFKENIMMSWYEISLFVLVIGFGGRSIKIKRKNKRMFQ